TTVTWNERPTGRRSTMLFAHSCRQNHWPTFLNDWLRKNTLQCGTLNGSITIPIHANGFNLSELTARKKAGRHTLFSARRPGVSSSSVVPLLRLILHFNNTSPIRYPRWISPWIAESAGNHTYIKFVGIAQTLSASEIR